MKFLVAIIAVFGGQLVSSVAGDRLSNNVLLRYMCGKVACDDLIVETKQGKLQGRAFESVLNKNEYYAFLGIPYAKPPLGELRFQAPEPADSWDNVYDAYYERSMCKQVDFVTNFIPIGAEDCLHLTVYTPELPKKIKTLKPVMVSIHGGGFCRLSGSRRMFSADYLITKDIVLVSINYRLMALGFLNLGIPESPGNVGLKDQVLALKWVQQNIERFGGDPNKVTIFGESAGGSSVHYHTISPMSKGLFHKAIMQSGSALSPWGLTFKPIQQAFEIGKRCGYKGNDTKELMYHLRNQTSSTIVTASMSWISYYRDVYPARIINIGPSVETIQEGAFLPDWPTNLIKTAAPVPAIYGVNDKEGILSLIDMNRRALEMITYNFSLMVSNNFRVDPKLVPQLSAKIKKFYFGDKKVGHESAEELIDLFSDIFFYYAYDAIDFLTNSSIPPYIYEFSYNGRLNYLNRYANFMKRTKIRGASHGDDQFYLFYQQFMPSFPVVDSESKKMIDIMITMWTNFAKTGIPSGSAHWNVSTFNEPCYLEIDERPEMMPGKFYNRRLDFLKGLLDPVIQPGTQPYDIF
ncbi:esterase E4-like [Planococcus citri]|uniref:esterase E4-like n=1 Tax=Planococcus citri TaxID=170843 RepID=UPI0031F881D1